MSKLCKIIYGRLVTENELKWQRGDRFHCNLSTYDTLDNSHVLQRYTLYRMSRDNVPMIPTLDRGARGAGEEWCAIPLCS
jgi:hypothetical protein